LTTNRISMPLNPVGIFAAYRDCAALLDKHRHLARALLVRDVVGQYTGQILGIFWTFAHPIFLITLFIFVFGIVFRTRIDQSFELPRDYTTYILAGLVPWLGISATLSRGSACLISQANLVKQVVFPIELAPIVATLSASVPQIVGFSILLVFLAVVDTVPATFLLLPVVFGLQLVLGAGLAFMLAVVTPYFRDLKDFVQIFTTMGVYILPIVYLPTWVPASLRPILYANPFSYVIWCYQDVFYFGRIEHPWAWVIFAVMSMLTFSFGYQMFQRLKSGLGTVL
jgi:lipopolysaccharide transport system permease protein